MSQPVIEEQNQETGAWEVIPQPPEPAKPVAAAVDADDDDPPAAPVVEAAKPVEQKPTEKPRNRRDDPSVAVQAAIAKQRDAERRAEEAERKARDLEARLKPSEPAKPAAAPVSDKFPDYATYLQAHQDATLEQWMDARDEWRDTRRDQQQRVQADKAQREQTFSAKAQAFSEKFKAAPEAVRAGIDQKFFTAKPLSTLTAEDKALIGTIPDQQTRDEFAFLCFLADQWIDSEHAVDLLAHISEPANFQRLATLPPNQVIRELARVEARLGAAPVQETAGSASVPKPKSQATPPIQPVRGSSQPVGDDEPGDDASDDEWYRWHTKQAKRGR